MFIKQFMTFLNKPLGQAIVLALLVWGAYGNSLHNPFEFDDWHVIPQNPAVRGPENIPSFFVDISTFSLLPGNRDYRPLFLTSMALSWWVGGGDTFPFHIVSVCLHMGNVLLLFAILRVFLCRGGRSAGGLPSDQYAWVPFLSAALFALHPLASESVNYISSQAVPLTVFFYLLSFYGFLVVYGRDTADSGKRKWLYLAGSLAAYFLALLGKPTAISLPLMLILWDLIYGDAFFLKGRLLWKSLGTQFLKHCPYWAISLLYLGIRQVVVPSPGEVVKEGHPILFYYLTQTKALVWYYLKLAILPVGLNVDREYPLSDSILDVQVLLSIVIIIGIAYLLFRFRHYKYLVFWTLWFPTGLLLTSYVVVLGQLVNEHRVYLSLAGLCAVTGFLGVKFWHMFPVRISKWSIGAHWGKPFTIILMLVIFFGMGYETRARNHIWSSDLTLWGDAALHDGTWRAHMNYGLALEGAGRADEALVQFEEAVRLGSYAFAHLNLGFAHVKRHNIDKGLAHLRTAVRLWPSLPEAHLYLAYGLGENGNLAEAEQEFRQALKLRPNYLKGYRFLATFYEKQGRLSDAILALKRLQALDPGQVWVGNRIALLQNRPHSPAAAQIFAEAFAYQKQGERALAIQRYEQLLKVDPNHRQGNFNLAYAYLHGTGQTEWKRSAIFFHKVIKIDPQYFEALHRLATVYWKLEKETEAVFYDQRYLEQGPHRDLRMQSKKRLVAAGATPILLNLK